MLMPATYEKLSPQVHVMILDVQWLSFTTDSWTNPMKSCSLLSFTAHFLHQSERRKVILAAMVLEQDHTDQSWMKPRNSGTCRQRFIWHWRQCSQHGQCHAHRKYGGLWLHGSYTATGSARCTVHPESSSDRCSKWRKIVMHFKHSQQASSFGNFSAVLWRGNTSVDPGCRDALEQYVSHAAAPLWTTESAEPVHCRKRQNWLFDEVRVGTCQSHCSSTTAAVLRRYAWN